MSGAKSTKGGNVILRRRETSKPDSSSPKPSTEPEVAEIVIGTESELLPLPELKPKPKRKRKSRKLHEPKDVTPIVLILAAGTEAGWEKKIGKAKQLLRLGKECVLARIIRQVRERGYEPVLVTHREDFIDVARDLAYYEPASRASIADTILHTQELWGDQATILLGDVVFGAATLDMVMAHRGAWTAFGNGAEIFAFSFQREDHEYFISTLKKVIAHPLCKKGAPWQIYRIYCGKRPEWRHIDGHTFKYTRDATGDIDSHYEYRAMRRIAGKL